MNESAEFHKRLIELAGKELADQIIDELGGRMLPVKKLDEKEEQRKAYLSIQARLVEQDSSFRQFALEHGYEPRTVTQAVTRYAGRHDLPRGRLTFRILLKLSQTIGTEVVPGIYAAANDDAA